jgi:L-rhamnose-H+ transport protein
MLSWAGIVLAGLLNGSFAVPLKTARTWRFNHIWTVHTLLAMAVIPWVFTGITVPRWNAVLQAVPLQTWLKLMGWGVLFGIASLLYGVAVDLLGIALGFAIQLGLSIVLGSLLPLLWARAIELRSGHDWYFILGLGLMVVGVILCARAGGGKFASTTPSGRRFRLGLMIALAGGILAPTLNFGIQYGTTLLSKAGESLEPDRFPVQTYLAWAVFLSSAALLQASCCLFRVIQENSTGLFRKGIATRDALQVLAMSSLWISSVFIYGRSAFGLGRLGNSFGWPIFIALIILTSNAWGVLLGEWREAARAAWHRMILGSGTLIIAAFIIGQSKRG